MLRPESQECRKGEILQTKLADVQAEQAAEAAEDA